MRVIRFCEHFGRIEDNKRTLLFERRRGASMMDRQGVSSKMRRRYMVLATMSSYIIPKGVTNMYGTFNNCTVLTKAPAIPENVSDMRQTFYNCSALTGRIRINANPSEFYSCFEGASTNAGTLLTVDYTIDDVSKIDAIIRTGGSNIKIGVKIGS